MPIDMRPPTDERLFFRQDGTASSTHTSPSPASRQERFHSDGQAQSSYICLPVKAQDVRLAVMNSHVMKANMSQHRSFFFVDILRCY